MEKKLVYAGLIVLFSLGFSLSYTNADNLSSEDEVSVELKIVCAGAGQSDCSKAAMLDNHEELYVSSNPFLSTKDIVAAKMTVQEAAVSDSSKEATKNSGGKISSKQESGVMIVLQFNKEGTQKFNEITSKNAGRRMAIFIDGSLLATPKIYDPVTTGKITIITSLTKEEAQALVARINKTITLNAVAALSSPR